MSEDQTEQSDEQAKPWWQQLNEWTPRNLAIVFAVIILPAIVFMVWWSNYEPEPDTSHLNDVDMQQVDAERYCKAEVEARLKSPASAEYSNVQASGFGTITVRGNVDAQNSFGALMRNTFDCTVTLEGNRWRLDNITVE